MSADNPTWAEFIAPYQGPDGKIFPEEEDYQYAQADWIPGLPPAKQYKITQDQFLRAMLHRTNRLFVQWQQRQLMYYGQVIGEAWYHLVEMSEEDLHDLAEELGQHVWLNSPHPTQRGTGDYGAALSFVATFRTVFMAGWATAQAKPR